MKHSFSKIKFTVLSFIALTSVLKAQQTSLFNLYNYDLMQLNIASIGRTCFEANLNYRTQWQGAKETPKLYQLNTALALGEKSGVGLKVAQSSMGLLKVTNATFGYSYRVKLTQTSKLHFGLGLALQQNSFSSDKAIVMDNNDLSLSNNLTQRRSNNLDAEAGALFLGDKLTMGVSAVHIYNANKKFDLTAYTVKPQVNAVIAYKFNKGKSVELEPWLVDRFTVGGLNQAEGILNVRFKQMFTLGAGYRMNYGLLALAGLELNKMKVAYSFDYAVGNKTTGLGASHQILISFDLCRNKKAKENELPVVTEEKTKVEEKVLVKEEPKIEEPKKVEAIVKAEEPKKIEAVVPEKKVEPAVPVKKAEIYKTTIADINAIAEGILFDVGKTTLYPFSLKKVDQIAALLKSAPDLKVVVEGRASPDGNKALNDALSLKRAEYIRNELIKRGVNVNNIRGTVGVGSEKSTGSTANSRSVHFIATN